IGCGLAIADRALDRQGERALRWSPQAPALHSGILSLPKAYGGMAKYCSFLFVSPSPRLWRSLKMVSSASATAAGASTQYCAAEARADSACVTLTPMI